MPQPIIKSPNEARSATKEGVVRYILVISVVLVMVLFGISYVLARHIL